MLSKSRVLRICEDLWPLSLSVSSMIGGVLLMAAPAISLTGFDDYALVIGLYGALVAAVGALLTSMLLLTHRAHPV